MSKLIFLGLSSSVGKSTVVTICCRALTKRGYDVAPFKAFNLSSIAFEYENNLVGYAQYIQALAANKAYKTEMNPIFKYYTNGELLTYVKGQQNDYLSTDEQMYIAYKSFEKLEQDHNLVLCEGSGSFQELNLKTYDYANLKLATTYNIPIIIVADISKGGVFGNLYGHIMLLTEEERQLLKGIIINKYDGSIESFNKGKEIIEELCQTKVIGILPNLDFDLPEEDGENSVELNETEITRLCNVGEEYIDFDYIGTIIKSVI